MVSTGTIVRSSSAKRRFKASLLLLRLWKSPNPLKSSFSDVSRRLGLLTCACILCASLDPMDGRGGMISLLNSQAPSPLGLVWLRSSSFGSWRRSARCPFLGVSAYKEESWFLGVEGWESCFGRGNAKTSGVYVEKNMTRWGTSREQKEARERKQRIRN